MRARRVGEYGIEKAGPIGMVTVYLGAACFGALALYGVVRGVLGLWRWLR